MADGYGEFGGGGSVRWKIDVSDAEARHERKQNEARGYVQSGVDKYRKDDTRVDFFQIAIKRPVAPHEIRAHIADDGRLVLYIPIEPHNEDQIKISWAYADPEGAAIPNLAKLVIVPSAPSPEPREFRLEAAADAATTG